MIHARPGDNGLLPDFWPWARDRFYNHTYPAMLRDLGFNRSTAALISYLAIRTLLLDRLGPDPVSRSITLSRKAQKRLSKS